MSFSRQLYNRQLSTFFIVGCGGQSEPLTADESEQ